MEPFIVPGSLRSGTFISASAVPHNRKMSVDRAGELNALDVKRLADSLRSRQAISRYQLIILASRNGFYRVTTPSVIKDGWVSNALSP